MQSDASLGLTLSPQSRRDETFASVDSRQQYFSEQQGLNTPHADTAVRSLKKWEATVRTTCDKRSAQGKETRAFGPKSG